MRWAVTIVALAAVSTPILAQDSAFVSLFSGNSLNGWIVEHADRANASEGVLRIGKGSGWLRTKGSEFENFRLRFDVQGASSTRVLLGLFGRTPRNGGPGSAFAIPLLGGEALPASALGGMRLKMITPSRTGVAAALRGSGEWQSYEVVRVGREISVMLNQSVILHDSGPAVTDGWIGFLADGGGFALRNVRIAQLPKTTELAGGVYRPGAGVTLPVVLKEVRPQYTADAMRAQIAGSVELECVVTVDGTVGDVQIIRSLDSTFGLDQEAVKAARQWRFRPGMRMGQPVPVLVSIELTFSLRK